MTEKMTLELLAAHGIKPTANRMIIARTLASEMCPMSLMELEQKIQTIDKSSISRALALFREHHLVHTIENGASVRYELCLSEGEDDTDRHAHFFCECCHRTSCLDGCPVPEIALPHGFVKTVAEYTVRGICPECAGKMRRHGRIFPPHTK